MYSPQWIDLVCASPQRAGGAAFFFGYSCIVAWCYRSSWKQYCWPHPSAMLGLKALVFPDVKQNGKVPSLPGRQSCFKGVRAVNANAAPQQTTVIENLPKTRSECVPVTHALQASTFATSRSVQLLCSNASRHLKPPVQTCALA